MRNSFLLKYFRYSLLTLLFSYAFLSCYSNLTQASDTSLNIKDTINAEQLIRGERLFYGLVYLENKTINCAGCHNTRFSDTLNWNPNAIEISQLYLDRSVNDLSRALLKPSGEKLAQAHKGFQFTTEDVTLIKAFMDKLTVIGLKQNKPVITNLLLFIIASVLFLFSIIDLIIIKRIKKQFIHFTILTFTGILIVRFLVIDAMAIGHSPDYSPDQPVKFSHKVHAGQNKIDCIYCHSYATSSKSAGFPAENICMNCHLLVRNGTRSGAFEISKVIDNYESNQKIEWVKVHNLPDHVFFSHAQHVNAGGIACQECHGSVEKMDRISISHELTMGWCINCHRSKKVNFQNNKFYSEYKDLADRIRRGVSDSVSVADIGGTECMKCHY